MVASLFIVFLLIGYGYDDLDILGLVVFTCLNSLCFLCFGFGLLVLLVIMSFVVLIVL